MSITLIEKYVKFPAFFCRLIDLLQLQELPRGAYMEKKHSGKVKASVRGDLTL